MKKFTADAYREKIARYTDSSGAFLRISRGAGLFVSNAPVKMDSVGHLIASLSDEFDILEIGSLLYFTPKFSFRNPCLKDVLIEIMKAEPAKKDKLVRQSLAKAMREKDHEAKEIFESILKGDEIQC